MVCADKQRLSSDKQQLEQDKVGMKEELVRTEQEKLDLDVEKSTMTHTLEQSEEARTRVEEDVRQMRRERVELVERVTAVARQRVALQEEMQHQKQEVERCQATIIKLLREKEVTNKELIDAKHDIRALGIPHSHHLYLETKGLSPQPA